MSRDDERRGEHTLKVHHLRPAPGSRTAKTRVGRGEGAQGQDRRSRHQGHQGPLPGAGRLRGRPDAAAHAAAQAARASRTRSGSSTRSSTSTGSAQLFPDGGAVAVDDLVAKGAVRDGQPGQGARHRRDRRSRVQVSAHAFSAPPGEDRGGRRHGHHALSGEDGPGRRRRRRARPAIVAPGGSGPAL